MKKEIVNFIIHRQPFTTIDLTLKLFPTETFKYQDAFIFIKSSQIDILKYYDSKEIEITINDTVNQTTIKVLQMLYYPWEYDVTRYPKIIFFSNAEYIKDYDIQYSKTEYVEEREPRKKTSNDRQQNFFDNIAEDNYEEKPKKEAPIPKETSIPKEAKPKTPTKPKAIKTVKEVVKNTFAEQETFFSEDSLVDMIFNEEVSLDDVEQHDLSYTPIDEIILEDELNKNDHQSISVYVNKIIPSEEEITALVNEIIPLEDANDDFEEVMPLEDVNDRFEEVMPLEDTNDHFEEVMPLEEVNDRFVESIPLEEVNDFEEVIPLEDTNEHIEEVIPLEDTNENIEEVIPFEDKIQEKVKIIKPILPPTFNFIEELIYLPTIPDAKDFVEPDLNELLLLEKELEEDPIVLDINIDSIKNENINLVEIKLEEKPIILDIIKDEKNNNVQDTGHKDTLVYSKLDVTPISLKQIFQQNNWQITEDDYFFHVQHGMKFPKNNTPEFIIYFRKIFFQLFELSHKPIKDLCNIVSINHKTVTNYDKPIFSTLLTFSGDSGVIIKKTTLVQHGFNNIQFNMLIYKKTMVLKPNDNGIIKPSDRGIKINKIFLDFINFKDQLFVEFFVNKIILTIKG